MIVCFQCGAANSPGKKNCHSCGAPLPASEPEVVEEQSNPAQVICFQCGHSNSPSLSNCESCGAVLPKMDLTTHSSSTGEITALYDCMTRAAENVRSKKWTIEEFGNWLTAMKTTVDHRRDDYVETVKETDYYEYRDDEVELTMTGVLEYYEGLELMTEFVSSQDFARLDDALGRMWEGNVKINEAMRANRDFRRDLEECWGYM